MSLPVETSDSQLLFKRHPLKDILYGSLAGIFSKLFEHPFDLVKVRLQTQPVNLPSRYNGPLDCFRLTFTQEGVRGCPKLLAQGVSMPVVGAMAENATLFLVYGQVQQILRRVAFPDQASKRKPPPLPLPYVAFAAACGGAMASFILTPIELVKCRMQVQQIGGAIKTTPGALENSSKKLQGPVGIVRSVIRDKGFTGLWLGQTGTLLRETGGSAIWFCSFETLVALFIARRERIRSSMDPSLQTTPIPITKGDLSSSELMISGATAGILYNFAFFPADSIKSTIQTAAELQPGLQDTTAKQHQQKQKSFIQVGRGIVKSRGWRALYAGCGITCLKSAPSSALIFWIVSRLEARFG